MEYESKLKKFQENAFQIIGCKMSAIFFTSQRINKNAFRKVQPCRRHTEQQNPSRQSVLTFKIVLHFYWVCSWRRVLTKNSASGCAYCCQIRYNEYKWKYKLLIDTDCVATVYCIQYRIWSFVIDMNVCWKIIQMQCTFWKIFWDVFLTISSSLLVFLPFRSMFALCIWLVGM